ncbi:MAG: M20/M25/M40 family metallo-hydrolase [Ignavibacteriales bacterium]|nr:M20/M25/M40 family metallo-hydrolase [Ignavibacteriales bacterium]
MKYVAVLLVLVLYSVSIFSQPAKNMPGLSNISQKYLMKTVTYLASKELGGRLSGSEGYNKAASYMANEFSKLGLNPFGDSAYYQNLNVEYNEIYSPVKLNLIEDGNLKKEYKLGKDFVCRELTGSGHVTAPVVFCGYGLSKPEFGYDDYAAVDVKGKIVIVFKSNPPWKMNDTSNWGNGYPRFKAKLAKEHGAVGILIVSLPNDAKPQKAIISVLEGGGEQDENFPQFHIDIPVVDEILTGSGFTLKDLQTKIDSSKQSFAVQTASIIEMEVHSKYTKEKPTMNIVGKLEGSDPKLKNEYVVVGAHLDHVGEQAGEIYAPGANDNASGSAAVLEIARAFVKSKVKPKRSIIFVLLASEELGLIGSKYFVDHSPVPLEKITSMINLDCVGYGDSIQIGNGKSAPNLWKIAKHQDSLYTKMMVEATWKGGGADAGPFHDKGIPAAYFVTTNSYAHLHYMTDTPETLNKSLFEKITKLAYCTTFEVVQGRYNREEIVK